MTNNYDLKDYFISYLERNVSQVGLFEFGVGGFRLDLMILQSNLQRFKGFEFKKTRQDFLKDIRWAKWINYLNYCHTFTWVCPEGLIDPEEISFPAGLLWIGDNKFDSQWKKLPKALEMKQENFNKIVCLFIERIKFRKDDFY